MAEAVATPRINATYLDNFTNQTVRLIGKVVQLRGDQATVDSMGNVTAHLNRDSHLTVGHAIEIVGKVNQDLSIKVLQAIDMGPDLDMKSVNAVVDATHRHKEIFYGSGTSDA